MCLFPKNIINPRKHFRPLLDKMYLTVPCGHCPECVERLHNDWYVRLVYEFERYKKFGSTVFVTLSYNDDTIPTIDLSQSIYDCLDPICKRIGYCYLDDENNFSRIPFAGQGFNKEHLRKFFKSFRQILTKDWNCPDGVKYMVFCEYGGEFHRPHYHVLLFIPFFVDDTNSEDLLESIEKAWSDKQKYSECSHYVRKLVEFYKNQTDWQTVTFSSNPHKDWKDIKLYRNKSGRKCPEIMKLKGFAMYSKKGPVVQSMGNFRYLMKYLEKDSEFMSTEPILEFYELVQELPAVSNLIEESQKQLKYCVQKCKDFFPFHMQSNGIGLDLFDELQIDRDVTGLSDEEIDKRLKTVIKGTVNLPNDTYNYSIPTYIINHLFYYYDKNPFTHKVEFRNISSYGQHVLLERFENQVTLLTRQYESFDKIFPQFLSDVDKEVFKNIFHISFEEMLSRFKDTFGMFCTYQDLAIYKLIYQNVSLYAYKDYDGIEDNLCYLAEFARNLFYNKIVTQNERTGQRLIDYDKETYNNMGRKFNDLSCYDGFDFYLQCMDYVRSIVLNYKYNSEYEKQVQSQKLKTLISHYIYGI